MTSKNSFWISLREQMKRRIWPFALYTLLLVFLYPVRISIVLSNEMTWNATKMNLLKDVFTYLGFDVTTMMIVAFAAVLSALQGFSWLYQRKKVDMYMSQPISSKKLFFVNYISGIITFFVPFIVMQWISVLIACVMGASSTVMQINNLYSLLIELLFFFVIYNITILAMMLCGHMAIAGLATGTFLFYEFILYGIIGIYYDSYFRTFSSRYMEIWEKVLSPFYKAFTMCENTRNIWDQNVFTLEYVWENIMSKMAEGMVWFLLLGVVTLVLAFWCFKHRPMENSDKAIAFPKIKQPVKVLIMIVGGLGMSICLYSFSQEQTVFAVIGLVSGIIISQCIMEIIYDFDIKAFAKGRVGMAVGTVVTIGLYLIFAMDLLGYDSYIPKQEDVASAAISIQFYTDVPNRVIEDDYNVTWSWEKPIEEMEVENIEPILKLAQHGMGRDDGKFEHVATQSAEICYHMKNGKDIYRRIPIDYEADAEILDELFLNKQFKAACQLSEDLHGFYEQCNASYSNGIFSEKIIEKNAAMIMEYYRQDYMDMTFTDIKDAIPCGIITLSYLRDGYPHTVDYPVYPSYDLTLKYLDEKGIEIYGKLSADAVESIEVTNFDYVEVAEYSAEEVIAIGAGVAYSTKESRTESIVYDKKEEIQEILDGLYPSQLMDYRYISENCARDMDVVINMKETQEAYQYDWYSLYMQFARETVPEFVCKDLKYDSSVIK